MTLKTYKKKLFASGGDKPEDPLCGGILMPSLVNQWKLVAVSCLSENELDLIKIQATSLAYSFAVSTHPHQQSLTLVVEEAIHREIASIVRKMMLTRGFDITVANVDGSADVSKLTTFKDCRGIGYEYKYDYSTSTVCKYPMRFSCNDIVFS